MPPVMGGERDGKERERKITEKKERVRTKKRNGEAEAEGEKKRRRRRWMLINYRPSGSKSSSFKCGVGAAQSHGGSY